MKALRHLVVINKNYNKIRTNVYGDIYFSLLQRAGGYLGLAVNA